MVSPIKINNHEVKEKVCLEEAKLFEAVSVKVSILSVDFFSFDRGLPFSGGRHWTGLLGISPLLLVLFLYTHLTSSE